MHGQPVGSIFTHSVRHWSAKRRWSRFFGQSFSKCKHVNRTAIKNTTPNWDRILNEQLARKFKDERDGIPLVEFVGLRSKMYVTRDCQATGQSPKQVQKLFIDEDGVKRRKVQELDPTIKITGKGIKKSIAKTELTLQHFKDTLFGVNEAVLLEVYTLEISWTF